MKPAQTHKGENPTSHPQIVSREEWQQARDQLLVKEKAATRARDALAAERRRLPMVRIEKDYVLEGPDGKVSLPDLFEGRRQLLSTTSCLRPMSMAGRRRAAPAVRWSWITSATLRTCTPATLP